MINREQPARAVARLREIAKGIDGTGTAENLEYLAERILQSDPPSEVAKNLDRLADEIDGTSTETSIRQVANSLR